MIQAHLTTPNVKNSNFVEDAPKKGGHDDNSEDGENYEEPFEFEQTVLDQVSPE